MYKTFIEQIDSNSKVDFGTLEAKPKKDSDDPMGLHAVNEGDQKEKESSEISSMRASTSEAVLDAAGKSGKAVKG